MQIALTKKFLDVIKIETAELSQSFDPVFCWTANWTNVWSNRKEDMLVLTNNASRFTVAFYPFRRKDFKNIQKIIPEAIKSTFDAMNLNSEITEKYMEQLGEIEFVKNTDRKMASAVSKACLDCAYYVANRYNNGIEITSAKIGAFVSATPVGYSKGPDAGFIPYEKMFDILSERMGLPKYDFTAYELLAELDLDEYKAIRRIIMPADCTFDELHRALQNAFSWGNYHAYEFVVVSKNNNEIITLTNNEDIVPLYENAECMNGKKLSSYLYAGRKLKYIYDFGDWWNHSIKLVKTIEHCSLETPYLLEAEGQTPPEDVGGVGGYLDFLEIISDPHHPEYINMKNWYGFWQAELPDYKKKPRVLN